MLPDQEKPGPSNDIRSTTPSHIVVSTEESYTSQTPLYSSVQKTNGNDTIYVPLRGKRSSSPQLHATTPNVIRYEPVHVRASTMSQTTRPGTGGSIIINPLIQPADNPADGGEQNDVIIFGDSDNEAEFTPGRQKDVLF